ncbi:hypothetical protein QEN19_000664 [Hanseniaspora menglaensis]
MFASKLRAPVAQINRSVFAKRLQSSVKPVAPVVKKTSFFKKTFYSALLAGSLATGLGIFTLYKEQHPVALPAAETNNNKKKIVILGSGWAAITLLKSIDTELYSITLVSPRDHFLFTPLLPSAPVGTVALESITESVSTLTRQGNGRVEFIQQEATDVNPESKTVTLGNGTELSYDYLVFSVGAQPNTFGIPGVYENANFLKEASDSISLKNKLKENLQKAAELPAQSAERKKLLSFIVVGGGPTGVETAAELQDYVTEEVGKWNPELAADCKITLIEGLGNILGMFDKKMYTYAQDHLIKNGIDLKLRYMAQKVADNVITVKNADDQSLLDIDFGILVWATGNGTRPITANLMSKLPETQTNRRGLQINKKLELLGAEGSIYALGDCTFHPGFLPTAQVAHQEGEYLAEVFKVKAEIDNTKEQSKIERLQSHIQDFKYDHQGALCYIGDEAAINDVRYGSFKWNFMGHGISFKVWQSAYLVMAISARTKFLIAYDWIKVHLVGRQ